MFGVEIKRVILSSRCFTRINSSEIQLRLNFRFLLFVIILLIPCAVMSQTKSAIQKNADTGKKLKRVHLPLIGVINEASLTNGCGYYLSRNEINPQYIFMANPGAKEAFMNLDGRDTSLKFLSVSRWKDTKIGARRHFAFTAGNLKISVLTVVVRVSNENEMDGGLLKAFITISRGRSKKTVKVFGTNGC